MRKSRSKTYFTVVYREPGMLHVTWDAVELLQSDMACLPSARRLIDVFKQLREGLVTLRLGQAIVVRKLLMASPQVAAQLQISISPGGIIAASA